jgi:hypothetical protein
MPSWQLAHAALPTYPSGGEGGLTIGPVGRSSVEVFLSLDSLDADVCPLEVPACLPGEQPATQTSRTQTVIRSESLSANLHMDTNQIGIYAVLCSWTFSSCFMISRMRNF